MNDDQQKFMRTLFCLAILILWPVMMALSQLTGTMEEGPAGRASN